jgi:predicted metal-dependent enzyme (double-stranded beta helix superfamily)
MKITRVDFDRHRHLDPAAALLAGRHRRDRAREPLLPAAFDAPDACRAQIEHAFDNPGWKGLLAEVDGAPVGFAIMTAQITAQTHFLASFFPPRAASLGYAAHATKAGMEYDVYRALFAALAEPFVALGFFDFAINLPASDPESREAWASLGFGRTMTCAIRGVGPTEKPAATAVELHQVSAEDAEVIFSLNEELTLHHARSPIFNPFIRESDASSHEFQRNLLTEPAANAHWVAYEDGKPVGMNTFMQPFFLSPLTVPDKTIYLFQGIVHGGRTCGRRRHGHPRAGRRVGPRAGLRAHRAALRVGQPARREVLAEQWLPARRVRHAPSPRRAHRLGEQVAFWEGAAMAGSAYGLRALIDDITRVVRRESHPDARCDAIAPHLRRWMDGALALPERYTQPCDGGACGHLVYTDPEGEYFVISVAFPPGTSSGVHYHGAWGVIGILAGTDEETKYARDDSPEHVAAGQDCRLRQAEKIYSPSGTISYLRPPLEGFHRVRAAGGETGVSLHILGGTPDTHPHFACDGATKTLVDFPMSGIITHEPLLR